ncbi:hypothetical protein [Asticcacaulis sp. W401b]|jgi:hypothetical protein|uniref:hypothetical protein n=1 Tax=Asticcacaulis sp. W401b TaxID=3388666 RepID=UPI0039708405
MEKYHIELTENEKPILAKIDLKLGDWRESHDDGHRRYLSNKEPILSLLESLAGRQAIPSQRVAYWNDPAYRSGRIKASRMGLFERNNCRGDDIYTHPHFIPHLRYFLFGTDLPDAVVLAFEEKVGKPEWITSSDIVPLGKFARELARNYNLDRTAAVDEFFKLCLDMGLGLNRSSQISRALK